MTEKVVDMLRLSIDVDRYDCRVFVTLVNFLSSSTSLVQIWPRDSVLLLHAPNSHHSRLKSQHHFLPSQSFLQLYVLCHPWQLPPSVPHCLASRLRHCFGRKVPNTSTHPHAPPLILAEFTCVIFVCPLQNSPPLLLILFHLLSTLSDLVCQSVHHPIQTKLNPSVILTAHFTTDSLFSCLAPSSHSSLPL